MKNTLFIKTIAGFTVISFVLVLGISVASYHLIKNYHIHNLRNYLTETAGTLYDNVREYISAEQYESLDSEVKGIGNKVSYRITVIKPGGEVVADSEEEPSIMDNHRDRPEISTALQRAEGESIRYSSSLETDMLYRAFPIIDVDDNLIGILRVSIFVDQIDGLLHSLRVRIFFVSLIILLIAFLLIYVYLKCLTRPVRELTEAVSKISAGNFDVQVIPRKDDDIGYLMSKFNEMAQYVHTLIAEISYKKNTLDVIISSLKEGVVLIDRNGYVKEANNSFKSIVQEREVTGKKYWRVINQPELSRFISDLSETKEHLSREIDFHKTVYLGSGLITEDGEMLVLLHNITHLKNVERLKKDIVANVSHELRSPLTAIKGFTETLENEVSDTGKEFLTIIQRNINRLINIVNDLLTLSRLEQGESLEVTRVYLPEVINNIETVFRKKIAEKGLSFHFEAKQDIPEISADRFKIEQLLTNLVENAIQYTDSGSIRISLTADNRRVNIHVEDTGCGIPGEHLERIFERFYVVDKSRSRKYGGTGLGLAIVKHIALLHNGDVKVKSRPNEGTVFTISLPIE